MKLMPEAAQKQNAGFSSNDERENTLNQLLTEMDDSAPIQES